MEKMASQEQVEALLRGVVDYDLLKAFGITRSLSPAAYRQACRRNQAAFHQDRGNTRDISQIANAVAEVLSGRQRRLEASVIALASQLLQELRQNRAKEEFARLMERWKELDKQRRIERVTTAENQRRATLLLNSSERVARADATPHGDVKDVFKRAFGLSSIEAGILMWAVGMRGTTNSKRIYVAHDATSGLKIPTESEGCLQCPACMYILNAPAEAA